ncbi:hypothetical protein H232_3032 [Klebsiella pneumoniae UHKPC81]|nr:hypothetical protein H232_3032 [Klebsiella pneumoniae UHKPC81]
MRNVETTFQMMIEKWISCKVFSVIIVGNDNKLSMEAAVAPERMN